MLGSSCSEPANTGKFHQIRLKDILRNENKFTQHFPLPLPMAGAEHLRPEAPKSAEPVQEKSEAGQAAGPTLRVRSSRRHHRQEEAEPGSGADQFRGRNRFQGGRCFAETSRRLQQIAAAGIGRV